MALVDIYKVTFNWTSNQYKYETTSEFVAAPTGSGDKALGVLIAAQISHGGSVNVHTVEVVRRNVIS
jgi:hypothetical protein